MLFSGGGGDNGLRSRFVFTMVVGYVVWVTVWFMIVVEVWVTVDHGMVEVWVMVVVG